MKIRDNSTLATYQRKQKCPFHLIYDIKKNYFETYN